MDPIALLGHLQMIQPLCPRNVALMDSWYFSFNLATSYTAAPSSAKSAGYLAPWRWTGFAGPIDVTVETVSAGGTRTRLGGLQGQWLPWKRLTDNFDLHRLADALDVDLPNWMPVLNPSSGTTGATASKMLHDLHAQMATLAFPLGQFLNLSLCFKVPLSDQAIVDAINNSASLRFFAVPQIQISPTELQAAQPLLSPADILTTNPPPLGGFLWPLAATITPGAPVATGQITAYLSPAEFPPVSAPPVPPAASLPSEQSLIDMSTQWVARQAGGAFYGEPWTTTIVPRIANAFDLAQRVIDYARPPLDPPMPGNFSGPPADLLKLVEVLLRDMANSGLWPSPAGTALIDQAIAMAETSFVDTLPPDPTPASQLKPALADAYARCFRAAVQNAERGFDRAAWLSILNNTVPRVQSLLTSINAKQRASVQEIIDPLDRLQAIVADHEVLAALIGAQWAAAAGAPVQIPLADYQPNPLVAVPDPSQLDKPAGGTSTFALGSDSTSLVANPGNGWVTAAYVFSNLAADSEFVLSLGMQCQAKGPFLALTAFRFEKRLASDFKSNTQDWTVIQQFDHDSADLRGPLRYYEGRFTTPPAATAQTFDVTVVLHFDPQTSTSLSATWDFLRLLPSRRFFTAFQSNGIETGTLALGSDGPWWLGVPNVDHSVFDASTIGPLYRINVPIDAQFGSSSALQLNVELHQVPVSGKPTMFLAVSYLDDGVPTYLVDASSAVPLPWSNYAGLVSWKCKIQPSTTAGMMTVTLSVLPTIGVPISAWLPVGIPFDVPAAPFAFPAALSVEGAQPKNKAKLPLSLPSAVRTIEGASVGDLESRWFGSSSASVDWDDKAVTYWQAVQQNFMAWLDNDSTRMQLAEAHVSAVLSNLLNVNSTSLIPNFQAALAGYGDQRCSTAWPPRSPFGRYRPAVDPAWIAVPAGGNPTLHDFLIAFAANFAHSCLPPVRSVPPTNPAVAPEGLDPNEITPRPHPLVIPFDRLGALEVSADEDSADFQRLMSGVVVFMGADNANPNLINVRSLNRAQVKLKLASGDEFPLLTSALIPYRPNYINGQRSTTVTYDNAPLIINTSAVAVSQYAISDNGTGNSTFKLLYYPVTDTTDGWRLLPMLRFGLNYRIAMAVVTTGGCLPLELTAGAATADFHPSRLMDWKQGSGFLPVTATIYAQYLRHVPINQPRPPRLLNNQVQTQVLPTAPPGTVRPLAAEMLRETFSGESLRRWYGFSNLPPLPSDGQTWNICLSDLSFSGLLTGGTILVSGAAAPDLPGHPAGLAFQVRIRHTFQNGSATLSISDATTAAGPTVTIDLKQQAVYDLQLGIQASRNQIEIQWRGSAYDGNWQSLSPQFFVGANGLSGVPLFLAVGYDAGVSGSIAFSPPTLAGFQGGTPFEYLASRIELGPPAIGQTTPTIVYKPIKREQLPIVLLSPISPVPSGTTTWARNVSFTIQLGKPATELEVWSRWYRDTSVGDTTRRDVLAAVHRRRDTTVFGGPSPQPSDVWIDDPATADFLVVECVPWRVRRPSADTYQQPLSLPQNLDTTNELNVVRGRGVGSIVCQQVSVEGLRDKVVTTPAPNTVNVNILPGEVWELRVYSCVDCNLAGPWLAAGLTQQCPIYTTTDRKYYLMNPRRYLIEGAADVSRARVLVLAPAAQFAPFWKGWLRDLGIDASAKSTDVVVHFPTDDLTKIGLENLDLVLVLPGFAQQGSASLQNVVQPLAVPVVVFTANDAAAIGLGTAIPSGSVTLAFPPTPLNGELDLLSGGYMAGDFPVPTAWTTAPLEIATGPGSAGTTPVVWNSALPGQVIVAAFDKYAPLAAGLTAAERRVACLLPSQFLQPGSAATDAEIAERFVKGAVRWAARWPFAERLWRALQPSYDGTELLVTVDRGISPRFDLIGSLELQRQTWHGKELR